MVEPWNRDETYNVGDSKCQAVDEYALIIPIAGKRHALLIKVAVSPCSCNNVINNVVMNGNDAFYKRLKRRQFLGGLVCNWNVSS